MINKEISVYYNATGNKQTLTNCDVTRKNHLSIVMHWEISI